MPHNHAVVVAGAPRSGTTWVAEVLAGADRTSYVHEPDNHTLWPLALLAKRGLGRQPALTLDEPATALDRVWNLALGGAQNEDKPGIYTRKAAIKSVSTIVAADILLGGRSKAAKRALRTLAAAPAPKPRPITGPVVIKTVHSAFDIERVAEQSGGSMVVVIRNPRNAVASWLDLGWTAPRLELDTRVRERILPALQASPPPPGDRVVDTAWAYGLLDASLRKAAFENPDWFVVEHETLSESPVDGFRNIFEAADLGWSSTIERRILEGDRAGTGYDTARVRADLRHAWKSRLTEDQIVKVEETLQLFR